MIKKKSNAFIIPVRGPASPRRTRTFAPRFAFLLLTFSGSLAVFSAGNMVDARDWPQILGPTRNGIAVDEKLLESFPASGLKKVWTHTVGEGYSGPVVAGDRVIIFHRPQTGQVVECLSLASGKEIWRTDLPTKYRGGGIDPDRGPKAVPLIHEGKIYLYDTAGELYCLDLADGNLRWNRSTATDFRAPPGYFGFGSSPIVIGDTLIVNVGGNEAGIVGFDLETGKTRWVATDQRASYSSPVAGTCNGQPCALVVTRLMFFGIDPTNGKILFEFPFGDRGPTVNGAMPVVVEDHVFLTSSYGIGSRWLTPTVGAVKEGWSDPNRFESQYSTPILHKGMLYGSCGREDRQNGSYRCVEAATGKLAWVEDDVPVGHSILVGDKIVLIDHSGKLHILQATPQAFSRLYQAQLFENPSRAIPALARGKLLMRSNATGGTGAFLGRQGELACFEIGVEPKEQ
ncbi:MAG: PQQ-binding-like beta-propeller repeat protein [Planctomycetota bacterium]|nr:PQQ-binding-like beta-propeller repeat protein [Planctomycetota bacterium]